jgi:hypothetical protein
MLLGHGLKNVMWPFAKKQRFPGVKQNSDGTIDFSLSDEEAREAEIALHAFQDVLVHPEVADKVRNGTIAVALSRYAKGLVSMHCIGVTESEYRANWPTIRKALEKAVAAVWKSYSLCPLPIFLYHPASFLQILGMKSEARQLFALFLRKQSEFKMDQVDKSLLDYEANPH